MSAGPPRRVLVADDHRLIVRLLKQTFEEAGYLVTVEMEADRIADAVARERPELAVIDAQMPPRERFHALKAVRSQGAGGRPVIIVLSGHDEPAIRQRALDLGADAFLLKPWDPDELVQLAAELIG